MKHLAITSSRAASYIVVVALLCGLVFLAIVGATFLFATHYDQHAGTDTSQCDDIIMEKSGALVCEITMRTPTDNIKVIRE